MRCYNLRTARQHLQQITALILDGQQLNHIPPEVWHMPKLEVLDLRRNEIAALPPELAQLTSLKSLLLGHNKITALPDQLPELVHLDLSHNRFVQFPPQLNRLEQLQFLHLSSNQLRSVLPLTLPRLKELHLGGNRLKHFVLDSAHFPVLEKLQLANNKLQALLIKGSIPSLHTLQVHQNRLEQLPDQFAAFPFLRQLDLSKNRLHVLPKSLEACAWLNLLNLSNNQLLDVADLLPKLMRLEALNLSENQLAVWPDLPQNLRQLNLAHNYLKRIPPNVGTPLSQLRQLDLSDNPLQSIHGLNDFPQLQALRLKRVAHADLEAFVLSLDDPAVIDGPLALPAFQVLLRSCRAMAKQKMSHSTRKQLWAAYTGRASWTDLPLPLLLQGLALNVPEIQAKIWEHLKPFIPLEGQFSGPYTLAVIGKISQTKAMLSQRLQSNGWTMVPPTEARVWLLGKGIEGAKLPAIPQEISFMREQDLEAFLRTARAFSAEESANLQQLLLHPEAAHVQLALQILKHHGVGTDLLPGVYIAWRLTEDQPLKRALRQLLERYWPPEQRALLRVPDPILRQNIPQKLEQLSEVLHGA